MKAIDKLFVELEEVQERLYQNYNINTGIESSKIYKQYIKDIARKEEIKTLLTHKAVTSQ